MVADAQLQGGMLPGVLQRTQYHGSGASPLLSERLVLRSGPSAEVEFWRPRAAMLMGLSEQLNLPRIRMMVDAVELGSSDQNLLSSFRIQHQDVKWVGPGRHALISATLQSRKSSLAPAHLPCIAVYY